MVAKTAILRRAGGPLRVETFESGFSFLVLIRDLQRNLTSNFPFND